MTTIIKQITRRAAWCSVFYEREVAFAHTHQRPVATILALAIA